MDAGVATEMERTHEDARPLVRQLSDGILRLTLDRPAQRNALSDSMLAALREAFEKAGADPSVRAIILAANGPVFCAGHDLKEVTTLRDAPDGGRREFARLMADCSAVMMAITDCPKPVIAEVQGTATAAGCQLVASCDLAVAADHATFATPGVHIGLFCSTPMVALSRNVSAKHAMEMLLTGDAISAEDAVRFGLINKSVPSQALTEHTRALAAKIAEKSMATVKTGKTAFYRQREMPLADAYAYCSEVMVDNLLHRDAQEGIGAFVEKRKAVWKD